jgi:hypothetical protein
MTREKAVDLVMNLGRRFAERLVLAVLAGPGAGIQGQRRLVVMGFNRRKMEDQRRTAAEKEAVTRRREFLWSLASF